MLHISQEKDICPGIVQMYKPIVPLLGTCEVSDKKCAKTFSPGQYVVLAYSN